MTVSECDRAAAAIEEFGGGELGRARRLLLQRHARRCNRCGSYLGRMKVVVRALDGLKRVGAPEGLEESIIACLARPGPPGSSEVCSAVAAQNDHRNLFLVAGAAGLGLAAVAVAIVRWALGRERDESLAPIAPA